MATEQPEAQAPLVDADASVEHSDPSTAAGTVADSHSANVPPSQAAPVADEVNREALHASRADVWYLKEISFRSKPTKIITQNYNGCAFYRASDFIGPGHAR